MPFFNQELGLVASGAGEVSLDTRDEHQVAPGTIHFAVLATLGEVAAASVAGAPVVPVDVQTRLLRRARPGRLVGRGHLLKRGRSLVFTRGEVLQDEELVAEVAVTFAVASLSS